jgi:uncharacterized membrane protein YfcA
VVGLVSGGWWFFVVLGLCAGVISGTLGVGSGIILVPTLVLLCSFEQKAAQGTALAVMVPMALVGAIRYWRNPQVELNGVVILLLILGAVAGALAGTELAGRLPAGTLRKLFALLLIVAAIRMFIASPQPKKTHNEKAPATLSGPEAMEPGGTNDSTSQR